MKARDLRIGQKFQTAQAPGITFEVASRGMIHFRVKGRSDSMWMTHGAIVTLIP